MDLYQGRIGPVFFIKLANLASSAVCQLFGLPHIVCPELNWSSLLMASLRNHLRINRKRNALSQEEVAFLLGAKGETKGSNVSRDEKGAREPTLRAALAYKVIYGKPVCELFPGLYEQVEQDVRACAKILSYRKGKPNPKRHATLINLVSPITV